MSDFSNRLIVTGGACRAARQHFDFERGDQIGRAFVGSAIEFLQRYQTADVDRSDIELSSQHRDAVPDF